MSFARPVPSQRRRALLVAVLFAASSAASLARPEPAFAWDAGSFSSSSERQLVSLTNRSRAAAGRKALKIDSTLSSIARWRSKDMIRRGYFSHTIPGYGSVFDKLSAKGYCFKLAGENIGWNTYPDDVATREIHQMFMGSSGHRKNILGKAWDRIGVGAYKGKDGKKMWTVLFADKCGGGGSKSTPKPASKSTPKSTPKPKPKATPKPTPKPTPTPTPTPPPIDPEQFGHRPGEDIGDAVALAGAGPPGDGSTARSAAQPPGLRVVDPGTPAGLVDTIVGGVTGLFFGA
jgi:uncharacterized protein YkwD